MTTTEATNGRFTWERSSEAHLLVGDVRAWLPHLPRTFFHAVLTSPPYWGLRRYTDDDGEVGQGGLRQYLGDLGGILNAAGETLRDDGVLWLNIGDTAVGSGGAGGDYYNPKGRKAGRPLYKQGSADGMRKGQWGDVPGRVVHALQDAGWLLRSRVTWDKGMSRPEDLNHVRRPGIASEPVFMLSRGPKYHFVPERLVERGDIWRVRPERRRSGHQAPFPTELVGRCLAPVSEVGDWVLDPFCGSGSTLAWAADHGRNAVGVELDERMVDVIEDRLDGRVRVWRSPEEAAELCEALGAAAVA